MHGSSMQDSHCVLMRRYACMALTNLTFGDSGNKTLLCSFRDFMRALIVQLQSPSDELRQVSCFLVYVYNIVFAFRPLVFDLIIK